MTAMLPDQGLKLEQRAPGFVSGRGTDEGARSTAETPRGSEEERPESRLQSREGDHLPHLTYASERQFSSALRPHPV